MSAQSGVWQKDGEIDLGVVATRLREHSRWIIASIIVVTVACLAAAFLLTPVYRATTVVMDASVDRVGGDGLGTALGALGGLASLAGLGGSSGGQIEEALAVLRSRE